MASYSISPVSTPWGNGGVTPGMGRLGADAASIVQSAGSIASAAIPATVAISHLTVFGLTAAMTVPVIGAIVAGITLALVAIFSRKGPKQKVATTEIVNKIEPLLQQNLSGYMAGPHTVSSRAQALANFDAGWAYVNQYCDIPEMGNPGQACVSDRQAGSCVWKDSTSQCWNWFVGYRDPIANDPNVVPDPTMVDTAGNLIDSITGGLFTDPSAGGTSSGMGWLLLAGGVLILAFSFGGGKK